MVCWLCVGCKVVTWWLRGMLVGCRLSGGYMVVAWCAGEYSHVVQDTPATVGVSRTQTLSTCPILLTRLNGDLCHL